MPRKKKEESDTAIIKTNTTLPTTDFVKVEKNLNSLGFFTPSSKTIKGAKAKTITFTRMVEGKKVEAKVTIAPAAIYGLPVTADQDKYFALQKIITDIRQEFGAVKNPVSFSSAEILNLLGKADAGKNYREILEWLKRMTSTTIISEGAVYFAGKKKWAQDAFHVFDRSVAVGQELPNGDVAEKNYVWLSEWQLENINNNHLLPVDFETYKNLKSHIAKALVPLLQIWLFASVERGIFEKRYDELCQHLNISQCKQISKIKERLGPALDELKSYGYILMWKIEPTSDKKSFKVVFYHGDKFHRDRRQRLRHGDRGGSGQTDGGGLTEGQRSLIQALVERGVLESTAVELIAALPAAQPARDQLEWIDELVKQLPPPIRPRHVEAKGESRKASTPARTPEDSTLIEKLMSFGIDESRAARLVETDREECALWVDAWLHQNQKGMENPPAVLISFIEKKRRPLPKGYRDAVENEQWRKEREQQQVRQMAEELHFQYFAPVFRSHLQQELLEIERARPDAYKAFKGHFDKKHAKGLRTVESEDVRERITIQKAMEFFNEIRPELGVRLTTFDKWNETENHENSDPVEWFNSNPEAINKLLSQ